jgi:2-succinyl-5-enolpyruvyl-6-hydroxy-3-cyclohexene-1-carboxylate synthase
MHIRQHIADIPAILRQKGVRKIIVSPGSRNAPLINSFLKVFGDDCMSIIDERSAAYVALGVALFTDKPVVLLCTSGTAALNYAPAMAEAFYQAVPLIAITADRPPEWIDQQDNQTIRQHDIYAANIKASFSLPVEMHIENELWHVHRVINEAFNIAVTGRKGPVHINVPMREPLYEDLPAPANFTIINTNDGTCINKPDEQLKKIWQKAKSILIIAGQQPFQAALLQSLKKIEDKKRICIIGEPVSNINFKSVIRNPDLILALNDNNHDLDPELLIYFGGQVVSNRLKQFLRSCNAQHIWFVDPAGRHVDTFRKLTDAIISQPAVFFNSLAPVKPAVESDYYLKWNKRTLTLKEKIKNNKELNIFSDLAIIYRISQKIASNIIIFAGNSTIVRYLGFFPPSCRQVFSNRGTSGIDGCLSTAMGIALSTNKMVVALVGDQSFVYDSNALWNRSLPDNLKIIVINNKGGGIFSLIEGPRSTPAFKNYLEAYHPVCIGKICEAFNVQYFVAKSFDAFEQIFDSFVKHKNTAVLEIITKEDVNPEVFSNFVRQIKIST